MDRLVKRIGVVSVARSDYGIYLPILRRIQAADDLQLHLLVSGMHLSPEFGSTVEHIEADGFEIADRIEMLLSSDSPSAIAASLGLGVIGFAHSFARGVPDLLMVLGDRLEMYAAALAALPFNLPLAHVHGGESTEGAIDDVVRHALTKMSHLHFVATGAARDRVIQMGEEPWRVVVSGAPGLDHLAGRRPLSRAAVEERIGFPLAPAPLLVTFHPETLDPDRTTTHAAELLAALEQTGAPVVFTYPSADTHSRAIVKAIAQYVAAHANACVRPNLGTDVYLSLMPYAAAMVGNSSSGIIEAASFELPVVNIGARQRGRLRARNVVDAPCERMAIAEAIQHATSRAFRSGLSGLANPYGDGRAAERIVDVLRTAPPARDLLIKRFHDLPVSSLTAAAGARS